MKKTVPIEQWILDGDFQKIKDYLKNHFHQYGAIYNTNELLQKVTGEPFNPQYYIDYLKEKYTRIYHL